MNLFLTDATAAAGGMGSTLIMLVSAALRPVGFFVTSADKANPVNGLFSTSC